MADLSDPELIEAELRARAERASDPYDEAVWRLMLGEADAGLAALRSAIDALAGATPTLFAAQLALLAGDPRAPALAAAAGGDTITRFVAGNREYHAALLALIAGDDDQARSHLADLRTFTAFHDKLRGGQPAAVADIPGGLLVGNAGPVTTGLEALLSWHVRRARARSDVFNSSRAVISLDAIVALILAHRRGLAVPIEPAHRAAQVPLLVVYLTEWQEKPLPRALPISIVTDLVAGPWLREHGIALDDPPAPIGRETAPSATASNRAPTKPPPSSEAEQAEARRALEVRMRRGGNPWQLASWSLLLDHDVSTARGHLQAAAIDARERWQSSAPQGGGLSRWFSKGQALPNQNIVREHLGFALALGDEAGLRETIPVLQAWLRTQEGRTSSVYAHAAGYLDLVGDLVGGADRATPSRTAVEQVSGPLPSTRVAAIALFERDATFFREGLESMLAEHAAAIERKTSPPPPICEPAVHLAAAARRLGVPVAVDERYATWPVPIEGARLACDVLGRALWTGVG